MTIEQLQTFVDSDPDLRQLINQVVDYLQANPGGTSTLQQTLDAGAVLDKDNTINANQHQVTFDNCVQFGAFSITDDTNGGADMSVHGGTDEEVQVLLDAYFNSDIVQLRLTPTDASIKVNAGAWKAIAAIAVADDFANDAAAATGGIPVGSLYHSSGTVKVWLT